MHTTQIVTLAPAADLTCRRNYPDSAAAAFIAGFLTLSQGTFLEYLNTAATQTLHDNLQPITPEQWDALKQYVVELTGGFGEDAFAGMPQVQKDAIASMIQVRCARGWVGGDGRSSCGTHQL